MAEPSLLCVNCAQPPPPHRRTWSRCTICVERNLPSTYYCGQECMNAHWPKHKLYHKAQQQCAMKVREVVGPDKDRLQAAAARRAEATGDEYDKRCAAAMALMAEGDHHAEAKAWRKIIKQWPHEPGPYYNLAIALDQSLRPHESAPMYLKAMELYEDGTQRWADSAAAAFDVLMTPECRDVAKPEWWNDEALKALAVQVVAVVPENAFTCAMRARVMCGDALGLVHWKAGPRTAAEVKEAATWYRRAAEVADLPVAAQCFNEDARICDEFADPLLAKEEAEAAEARAAAEAEAAEALKVAEAKAAAAAEELLAEEEKEKQQAAASTKVDQTKKGKGKKGKGKR